MQRGISVLKIILICLVSTVLVSAIAVGGLAVWAKAQLDSVHKVRVDHLVKAGSTLGSRITIPANNDTPFNVLLIGSDSRAFVSTAAQASSFGNSNDVTGQRSDVIKIMHVDPQAGLLSEISIPRDLWVNLVDVPGAGQGKINEAYNAGPSALVATIESNFNIPITHYAAVDFAGFSNIVDAIGGVKIYFPVPVRDAYTGLNQGVGCQTLNGVTALSLVRARHMQYLSNGVWQDDPLSDISRISRQDTFFKAVALQIGQLSLNPLTLTKLVSSGAKAVTLDSTWSTVDLISLANRFKSVGPEALTSTMLPTTGFVTSDGQDALSEAQPYANQALAPFQASSTSPDTTTTTTVAANGAVVAPTTTTTIPANIYSSASGNQSYNPTTC